MSFTILHSLFITAINLLIVQYCNYSHIVQGNTYMVHQPWVVSIKRYIHQVEEINSQNLPCRYIKIYQVSEICIDK